MDLPDVLMNLTGTSAPQVSQPIRVLRDPLYFLEAEIPDPVNEIKYARSNTRSNTRDQKTFFPTP